MGHMYAGKGFPGATILTLLFTTRLAWICRYRKLGLGYQGWLHIT